MLVKNREHKHTYRRKIANYSIHWLITTTWCPSTSYTCLCLIIIRIVPSTLRAGTAVPIVHNRDTMISRWRRWGISIAAVPIAKTLFSCIMWKVRAIQPFERRVACNRVPHGTKEWYLKNNGTDVKIVKHITSHISMHLLRMFVWITYSRTTSSTRGFLVQLTAFMFIKHCMRF